MHFTNYFSIMAFVATGVLASPMPDAKPPPPPKPTPTTISQGNTCGNGATPYCCNTDNFGVYTTCSALGMSGLNRIWKTMLTKN